MSRRTELYDILQKECKTIAESNSKRLDLEIGNLLYAIVQLANEGYLNQNKVFDVVEKKLKSTS
jgi:hypothetical protein